MRERERKRDMSARNEREREREGGVGERSEDTEVCERDRRETGVRERKIKRDSGWEREI